MISDVYVYRIMPIPAAAPSNRVSVASMPSALGAGPQDGCIRLMGRGFPGKDWVGGYTVSSVMADLGGTRSRYMQAESGGVFVRFMSNAQYHGIYIKVSTMNEEKQFLISLLSRAGGV